MRLLIRDPMRDDVHFNLSASGMNIADHRQLMLAFI
eukprot:CAMPEP_0184407988 /NCGR_PEP_ID=MMETSP0738-20130409/2852_1 /TAXON_ID=385413 /ORGANISM="Thalassiosira miniscula, Strain CCMP1093" /LENGTH=35 /DNA_ID= /DNA_START= /DNA_END= /DNA_ORIENTATION=